MFNTKFVCLIAIGLLSYNCNSKKEEVKQVYNDSIAEITKYDTNNIISQNTIQPYRMVDSLINVLEEKYDLETLLIIESTCQDSDGDLAENFMELSKNLLNNHMLNFTKFIQENRSSCLRKMLIRGLSVEIAVYEQEERMKAKNTNMNNYIEIAKKNNLPTSSIEVIKDLFIELKPEMFD